MGAQPVGRDAEIAKILALLSAASGTPAAVCVTGDAGIGKTVVWRHVVQAVGRSSRVLSCQAAWAERSLAFSALDDLLGDVAGQILPALPVPQREALEVALLHEMSPKPDQPVSVQAGHPPLDRRVLARGVLGALRNLSDGAHLMLAVDDAQWLDRPSASVLEFCFRRLECEPVAILLTFRTDDPVPLGLARAMPPDRLSRVQLGPLSLGAIGEILRCRLGASLPRHTLTRLYDVCGGNPFYGLECARLLLEHPPIPTNEPLPIPQNLSDLVRHRIKHLASGARRVGQLVAASPSSREHLILEACGDVGSWEAIDRAIDAGLLDRDGDVLRFTHPLLRSALYAEMTPGQRREVHRRLAVTTTDMEERAWHLALGAERPSEEIAGMLDIAAEHAASRGAPEAAAPLAEQAARLTEPSASQKASERLLHAADYHFRAGEMARSRDLIQSALAACPPGPLRAPLLLRLATIHYHESGWPLAEETFRQAAREAPEDPALRAHAEQELAFARVVAGDLPAALHLAKASLRSAQRAADPRLVAHSLARIAACEFFQGRGARPDLLARAETLAASAGEEPAGRLPLFGPSLVRGLILKWCDQLDEARLKLTAQYRHALDRGDWASLPFLLYHFSELECWAGNWNTAEEYALEGCRIAEENRQQPMRPATLYSLALVRAHRGQVTEARDLAAEALTLCEQTGNVPVTSQVLSVLGFLALSLEDYQAARSHLGRLAEVTGTFGLGEPSVVKFLPDEIEALVALGETDQARAFTLALEAQGKALGRPWALAVGARCRGQLSSADGDLEGAHSACAQALAWHDQLPMPFELGRTLLVKGVIERRAKQKSAARETLGQALSIFEQLGAPLWAAKAHRELAKIITRTAVEGLTKTEHRVAALVAKGFTNREVALTMFVTENTVQTHIQHIFQKLSVRSRTELAAWILTAPASTTPAVRLPSGRDHDPLPRRRR